MSTIGYDYYGVTQEIHNLVMYVFLCILKCTLFYICMYVFISYNWNVENILNENEMKTWGPYQFKKQRKIILHK